MDQEFLSLNNMQEGHFYHEATFYLIEATVFTVDRTEVMMFNNGFVECEIHPLELSLPVSRSIKIQYIL